MIEVIDGNIFDGNEDIIVHQTNCLGVMGGGIALQVKNLYPNVFNEYSILCKKYYKYKMDLLGYAQIIPVNDGKYIANCFGQLSCGSGVQTDYTSLRLSLLQVRDFALKKGLSVAIPYKIGCGLAGGNWDIVSKIIEEIFGDDRIKCVIYNFQG